jgi:hypothetical protein
MLSAESRFSDRKQLKVQYLIGVFRFHVCTQQGLNIIAPSSAQCLD